MCSDVSYRTETPSPNQSWTIRHGAIQGEKSTIRCDQTLDAESSTPQVRPLHRSKSDRSCAPCCWTFTRSERSDGDHRLSVSGIAPGRMARRIQRHPSPPRDCEATPLRRIRLQNATKIPRLQNALNSRTSWRRTTSFSGFLQISSNFQTRFAWRQTVSSRLNRSIGEP